MAIEGTVISRTLRLRSAAYSWLRRSTPGGSHVDHVQYPAAALASGLFRTSAGSRPGLVGPAGRPGRVPLAARMGTAKRRGLRRGVNRCRRAMAATGALTRFPAPAEGRPRRQRRNPEDVRPTELSWLTLTRPARSWVPCRVSGNRCDQFCIAKPNAKAVLRHEHSHLLIQKENSVVTAVGSAKPFATRFESYLRSAFHPIPQEAAVAQLNSISLCLVFFATAEYRYLRLSAVSCRRER